MRGYTIVEMILVMVISLLLAAVAAPVVGRIVNEHRLASVARQMGFEVVRARMQAVGQNRCVRLSLVEGTKYKREFSEDGASYTVDGSTISLPSGFSATAGSLGMPRFDRQGMAQGATAITVNGPTGQKTINVNVLGRVTIG